MCPEPMQGQTPGLRDAWAQQAHPGEPCLALAPSLSPVSAPGSVRFPHTQKDVEGAAGEASRVRWDHLGMSTGSKQLV